MKKYLVRKIYQHTADVVVEANSEREAKDIACSMPDEPNDDDLLYDCEIVRELIDEQL